MLEKRLTQLEGINYECLKHIKELWNEVVKGSKAKSNKDQEHEKFCNNEVADGR